MVVGAVSTGSSTPVSFATVASELEADGVESFFRRTRPSVNPSAAMAIITSKIKMLRFLLHVLGVVVVVVVVAVVSASSPMFVLFVLIPGVGETF